MQRPIHQALVLLLVLFAAQVLVADTVQIGTAPARPGKAGFTMTVEIEAVGGNGYQPMYLNFAPLGKQFNRDRYLDVNIGPREYYNTELDFDLRTSLKLPEGTNQNRFVVYIPHYYPWSDVRLSLIEDGRAIETSNVSLRLNGIRPRFARQRSTVGILVPSDASKQDAPWKKFPDVRTLVTVLGEGPIPEDVRTARLTHTKAHRLAQDVQPAWVQFRLIEEGKLHDRWIGYSQLDIILAADPVLRRIEKENSKGFEALLQWVAAGGNLWVYAPPEGGSTLDGGSLRNPSGRRLIAKGAVAKQLNLGKINDTSELYYETWNGVFKRSQHYSNRSQRNMSSRQQVYNKLKGAKHPFVGELPAAELAKQIKIGSFGAGKVVVIDSEDPFPGSFQLWSSVARLNGTSQVQWVSRSGIDVPLGNDNYWMWLIGSVGQPPVKSFVFLNTLFVIVVGPFCYFLFRRRGRLYLLYFFAPLLAVAVTTSLFAYALASDGTATQARVRQITWLDLRNGYAAQQSRQTYYAVFRGSDGLQYDGKAAVYPVRYSPATHHYYRRHSDSSRQGEMVVAPDSQRFSGSFLPPRNQVQYLVTEPKEMPQSLTFHMTAGSAEVTNHLPYTIDRLLVHHGGRHWSANGIASGNRVELVAASASDVPLLLNEGVLPPLGDVPMLSRNRGWGGSSAGMNVSALETQLERWSAAIPSGTFVATAPVDAQLGVKDAKLVGSVHVLMGELP